MTYVNTYALQSYIKNGFTHSIVDFMGESDLSVHGSLNIKKMKGFGTLAKIIYITRTRTREHNPIRYKKITNIQRQEIQHNTCVVFVSICIIFKYL